MVVMAVAANHGGIDGGDGVVGDLSLSSWS